MRAFGCFFINTLRVHVPTLVLARLVATHTAASTRARWPHQGIIAGHGLFCTCFRPGYAPSPMQPPLTHLHFALRFGCLHFIYAFYIWLFFFFRSHTRLPALRGYRLDSQVYSLRLPHRPGTHAVLLARTLPFCTHVATLLHPTTLFNAVALYSRLPHTRLCDFTFAFCRTLILRTRVPHCTELPVDSAGLVCAFPTPVCACPYLH